MGGGRPGRIDERDRWVHGWLIYTQMLHGTGIFAYMKTMEFLTAFMMVNIPVPWSIWDMVNVGRQNVGRSQIPMRNQDQQKHPKTSGVGFV